jgi:hypothetical protein
MEQLGKCSRLPLQFLVAAELCRKSAESGFRGATRSVAMNLARPLKAWINVSVPGAVATGSGSPLGF